MRILFITKEWLFHERLGIMYLSSALKQKQFTVRLVIADKLGINNILKLIKEFRPQVIGYTAMTGEYPALFRLNQKLKSLFNFIAVFGGPHATFFPGIVNDYGVDAVCVGEGEVVFPEFCRRVNCGEDFWLTPNFRVKYKDQLFVNDLLPLIENLDTLALPDRDLMYQADRDLGQESRKMFISGRGCPHHCAYCFNEKYNEIYRGKGRLVRYRSISSLIQEILELRQTYPLGYVWIDDDDFLVKPKGWFQDFAIEYKDKVGLPFSINLRANNVNSEILGLLKTAGLDSVWMGVECGNEVIANSILKRDLTNPQILAAAEILHRFKIKFMTENILGLPVDDPYALDLQTLDLNIRLKPTLAVASLLYPFPGTQIREYAITHSYLKEDTDYLQTSKSSSMFNFSDGSKRKVENLQKLFPLLVRFPLLRPLANLLASLPITPVYLFLFYCWYGYIQKFKIYTFRSITKEFNAYLRFYWSLLSKT